MLLKLKEKVENHRNDMTETIISEKKTSDDTTGMYERRTSYIFISYSHWDTISMIETRNVLKESVFGTTADYTQVMIEIWLLHHIWKNHLCV